jgi:hypothetical protein
LYLKREYKKYRTEKIDDDFYSRISEGILRLKALYPVFALL